MFGFGIRYETHICFPVVISVARFVFFFVNGAISEICFFLWRNYVSRGRDCLKIWKVCPPGRGKRFVFGYSKFIIKSDAHLNKIRDIVWPPSQIQVLVRIHGLLKWKMD